MENLITLIIAGGDSTRFWPLGDKTGISLLGKPLISRLLSDLTGAGLKQFVIITAKGRENDLRDAVKEFPNISIQIFPQTDPRGMAGAVLSAKKEISGKSCLVIKPVDFVERRLITDILMNIKTDDPDGIISAKRISGYFPGGYLTSKNGTVNSIVEKPGRGKEPSDLVALVYDYFKDADVLLGEIGKITGDGDDIFEQALGKLFKLHRFLLNEYEGYWRSLQYPWDMLSIVKYLLMQVNRKKIGKAKIAANAVIEGNVIIEDDAVIMEGAKISGPSYIGTGTVIGNNSVVRQSMIGANSVIGFACEIARSYVGKDCWFHSNYIGDSVIMDNVGMGAGTVLANYKLSENGIRSSIGDRMFETGENKLGSMIGSGVRIGINCSLMPGIKIGRNSFIGAGVLVDKDVPDGKYLFLKESNYKISDNKITVGINNRKEFLRRLR